MLEEDQFARRWRAPSRRYPSASGSCCRSTTTELDLREIGEILEVSESRVCQIHGQAVLRVRARLDRWFNDE